MGLEPTNLLTASQALYQLSYAPEGGDTLSACGAGQDGAQWDRPDAQRGGGPARSCRRVTGQDPPRIHRVAAG